MPTLPSSTSNNNLVLTNAERHLALYKGMCRAIGACHRVDECKDIADKSVALAAYYKQIKDDETVRKFNEVKLRAWRRIGELFSVVNLSGCLTQTAKAQKIRDNFDEAVVDEFSDVKIMEILKLTTLSTADFEFALKHITSGGITNLLRHTPEAVAQTETNHAEIEKWQRAYEKEMAKPENQQKALERLKQSRKEQRQREKQLRQDSKQLAIRQRHERELQVASKTALAEVGITLERKDRARMKQVVFLIKEEVHTVMRAGRLRPEDHHAGSAAARLEDVAGRTGI